MNEVCTTEERINITKSFIEIYEIKDEDIQQELYLVAVEKAVTKNNLIGYLLERKAELEKETDPVEVPVGKDLVILTNRFEVEIDELMMADRLSKYLDRAREYLRWNSVNTKNIDRDIDIFSSIAFKGATQDSVSKKYGLSKSRIREIFRKVLFRGVMRPKTIRQLESSPCMNHSDIYETYMGSELLGGDFDDDFEY